MGTVRWLALLLLLPAVASAQNLPARESRPLGTVATPAAEGGVSRPAVSGQTDTRPTFAVLGTSGIVVAFAE